MTTTGRLLLRTAALWALAGCGDSNAPPSPAGPALIKVAPELDTVQLGGTDTLTATVLDSAGNVLDGIALAWTNGAPAVAVFHGPAGLDLRSMVFSGLTGGRDSITVQGATGESANLRATAVVVVTPPVSPPVSPASVASVSVLPAVAGLLPAGTLQLAAIPLDSSGHPLAGRVVRWASNNVTVATVDSISGMVTAVAVGRATVGATGEGRTGTSEITVVAAGIHPPTGSAISAGFGHSCGLVGASLRCWGWNGTGELGIGSTTSSSVPRSVSGNLALSSVSAGIGDGYSSYTCGLAVTGAAYCWGSNRSGRLGASTTTTCFVNNEAGGANEPCSTVPLPVTGGIAFADLSAAVDHTCGVALDSLAYCWGSNYAGKLGTGDSVDRRTATPVAGGLRFVMVRAGIDHTCGLIMSGTAICWGSNDRGELGDGSTLGSPTPRPVRGGLTFEAVSAGWDYTCALASGGAAYCWGANSAGQLGTGDLTTTAFPVPVSGNIRFESISTGWDYTCGVARSGAAYCWGGNGGGQLGVGDELPRLRPALVAGGLGFATVSVGYGHTCGRSIAGTLYCWGQNFAGALGDGSTSQRDVPVKVAGQP